MARLCGWSWSMMRDATTSPLSMMRLDQSVDRAPGARLTGPHRDSSTPVKALARAWRWQRMLDDGVYASISEIGDAENISKSYVSRILRLALLAPDIIEAILAGTHRSGGDAGATGAAAAGELGGAARACTQRVQRPEATSAGVREVLRVSRSSPQAWPSAAQSSEVHLLFLSLRFRPAGLRFGERARRSAGRREGLLLVGLGLLRPRGCSSFDLSPSPVSHLAHHRAAADNRLTGSAPAIETARVSSAARLAERIVAPDGSDDARFSGRVTAGHRGDSAIRLPGFSVQATGRAAWACRCSRKNRSISRAASGPCGSV